mmetsp:Transcript_12932/g.33686  ORF Transcript_12932/g.33686 Transcript_12932/m.33686 type:complete len:237 (+) Transcript_12932:1-711(+)
MGALFSKRPAAAQVSDHDRALLQLKVQKDRVSKHRAAITSAMDREAAVAQEQLASGNRALARAALRRKRYWELHLDKTDQMLMRLEEVLASIEIAHVQKEVYKGLESGTRALKQMQSELSLEKVEQLMSERADALAVQEEIDRALAGSKADQDVEEEFARLEAAEVADALPAAPTQAVEGVAADIADALPAVPTQAVEGVATSAAGPEPGGRTSHTRPSAASSEPEHAWQPVAALG